MSSGGGKGGKKETETTIPDWVRGPAERNLRRAEQVQQLKYMPYTGPQVAAFNETQNAAMNSNIGAAKAFGLLDPNSTLTATSGMPAPKEYAGGFKGYGSIDIYDQALKELTARDPANMAAYNSLFGNSVPALLARGGGGGSRFRGGASPGSPPSSTPKITGPITDYTPYEHNVTKAKAIDAKYGVAPSGVEPGATYTVREGPRNEQVRTVQTSPIRWYDKTRKQAGVGGKYGFGL